MTEDYSQYDLSDSDPYLIENSTCLKNVLGFTDTANLNEAEQEITKLSLANLARNPVKPTFDKTHLQEVHKHIFDEVYPFAGKLRTVEIAKGGFLFLRYALIDSELEKCFSNLHDENCLVGLNPFDFAERAGFYLGWINRIHAFREGNGRAQRVLVDQLGFQNGYAIQWNSISAKAMSDACREARTVDLSAATLRKLLYLNICVAQ